MDDNESKQALKVIARALAIMAVAAATEQRMIETGAKPFVDELAKAVAILDGMEAKS